jgi:lysophospholipase L1-like esterase
MSRLYVALGDSMSIDDYAGGPARGAASLLHRNRDDDFPEWAGRDLAAAGYELALLAADGATSGTMLDGQLGRIPRRPDLITLTIGGNDLVVAYGNGPAARAAVLAAVRNVETALTRLRERFGDAPTIMLTTVYDPSDGAGELPGSGLPPWPEGLVILAALNEELRRLAAGHGTLLADVHTRFLGHGYVAGDASAFDARPADRNLWFCGTIEPNAWGASEIRAAWWEVLDAARVVGA